MTFRPTSMLGACAVLALSAAANAATIGITEFIIDPWGGDDAAPEYIELFNYGAAPVNLEGWTIKDNSGGVRTFPSVTVPSGGYLVTTTNLTNFQNKWLAGGSDDRVLQVHAFVLNNSSPGDGIYLRNQFEEDVWTLGYNVDAANGAAINPYRATFLAIDDFTTTNYGYPPQDGPALINRNGIDGTGTLGYEDNNFITDPYAYASSARDVDGNGVEFGSPLLGGYTAVPEPASLALLAIGGVAMLRRRAR